MEAGWYAVLRVPGLRNDEETALALLVERSVVIHPGSFFGFAGQGWLVVSLIAQEEEFLSGVKSHVQGNLMAKAESGVQKEGLNLVTNTFGSFN